MLRTLLFALALLAAPAPHAQTDIQADLDYIAEQSLAVNRLSAGLRLTTDGAAILWTTRLTGTTRIPANGVLVDVDGGTVSVRCADGSECIEGISGNSEGAQFQEFAIYPALSASPETAEVARRLRAVLERIAKPPPSGGSLADVLTGGVERADANVEAAFVDGLVNAVDQLLAADGDFASLRGPQRNAATWSGILQPFRTTDVGVTCSPKSCTYFMDFVERSEAETRALADRFESHLGWKRENYVNQKAALFECEAFSRLVFVGVDYVGVTVAQVPGPQHTGCASSSLAPPLASVTDLPQRIVAAIDHLYATGGADFAAHRGAFIGEDQFGRRWEAGYLPPGGSFAANSNTYCTRTNCVYVLKFDSELSPSTSQRAVDLFEDAHPAWIKTYTNATRGAGGFTSCGSPHRETTLGPANASVKIYTPGAVVGACATPPAPPLADGGAPAPAPSGSARPPIPATGTGCLIGNCRNGYGAWRNGMGTTYAGDFRNGERHGQGIYNFPGLRRYEGEFQNGNEAGRGVEIRSDGTRSEGRFVQGDAEGEHLITYPGGTTYRGTFRGGRREGVHTVELPNGETVRQRFADGAFVEVVAAPGDPVGAQGGTCITAWCWDGEGIMRFPNGRHYIGEWADGKPHGAGAVVDPEGTYKMAYFAEGRVVQGTGDITEVAAQARVLGMVEAFREAEGIAPEIASMDALIDALGMLLEAAQTSFASLRGASAPPPSDGRPTWTGTLRPDGFDIASTSCKDGVCEYTLHPTGYEFLSLERADALADRVATQLPEWQRTDSTVGGADFVLCGTVRHRVTVAGYGLTVMAGSAADFDLPACSR